MGIDGIRFAAFALMLVLAAGIACAGNATLGIAISNKNVILKPGSDSTDFTITVKGSDGKPAKGVWVFIRLDDESNTGILGSSGHADIVKFTDANGIVHGTVQFPSEDEIDPRLKKEFPIEIDLTVFSAKHDFSDEWYINGTSFISVDTASPKITGASLNPNPAKPKTASTFHAEASDVDSSSLTYSISSKYGTLGPIVASGKKADAQWTAPPKNYTHYEVELARSMGYGFKYMALDLASAGSGADPVKLRVMNSSQFSYPSGMSVYSNSQDLSLLDPSLVLKDIPASASPAERKRIGYNNIGLGFDTGKITIGFLQLQADRSQIVSGLANGGSGLADAFAGSLAARVADLEAKKAARATRKITQPYYFNVLVSDESGNKDRIIYPFGMEYSGFGNG